jgi:hypothetical protein
MAEVATAGMPATVRIRLTTGEYLEVPVVAMTPTCVVVQVPGVFLDNAVAYPQDLHPADRALVWPDKTEDVAR